MTLRSVAYANFYGEVYPAGWSSRPSGIDPVDLAVAIQFGGQWLRVDWAMRSITAGLSVPLQPNLEFDGWGVMDATRTSLWAPLVDQPLTDYQLGWFTAEDGADESLLAVRLIVGDGVRTILLADLHQGGLRYLPDSLIVADSPAGENLVVDFGGTWKDRG